MHHHLKGKSYIQPKRNAMADILDERSSVVMFTSVGETVWGDIVRESDYCYLNRSTSRITILQMFLNLTWLSKWYIVVLKKMLHTTQLLPNKWILKVMINYDSSHEWDSLTKDYKENNDQLDKGCKSDSESRNEKEQHQLRNPRWSKEIIQSMGKEWHVKQTPSHGKYKQEMLMVFLVSWFATTTSINTRDCDIIFTGFVISLLFLSYHNLQ